MAARKSKLDEAEMHLRQAMQIAPPSVELLSDLGYLCYLQSRFDEAEHYLLQALEQSPDHAAATNNLALVYGGRGDFEQSLRYFRRVSDEAKSHANVAFTMTQQGKLEDARHEYLHALTMDKTLRSAANALVQIEETRRAAEQAAKRRGVDPEPAINRDEVIELSSQTPAGQSPESFAPQSPVYQPQPRVAQRADASVQPSEPRAAQSATPDAVAQRLMPLPTPATGAPDAAQPSAIAARPHSRYSQPESAPLADNDSITPLAQQPTPEQIFAQARQVSWDAEHNLELQSSERKYGAIAIPVSEPIAPRDATAHGARPALATQPVKPAPSSVRQAAVSMEISDDGEASGPNETKEPLPEPRSVTRQLSDFGPAPARLNPSASARPLGPAR
jgi:Tfp pilus assembly protein PilF